MVAVVNGGGDMRDSTSWSALPAAQRPEWPDAAALRQVLAVLRAYPALVAPSACDRLRAHLAAVARGEAFLLQGGDCAETFVAGTASTEGKVRTLRQMAAVLTLGAELPVITVGRIAGQYAKPRSAPTETRGAVTLPAYRGDAVNDRKFTGAARTPDPRRLLRAYEAAAGVLDHLGSLIGAGDRVPAPDGGTAPRREEFFTSHEALLLDYEDALVRVDPPTGRRYGTSGHLLWIGDRTRQLDGAHVAFAASIHNPVAVKLGPTATADAVIALVDRLDPRRAAGRLTFVTRMGSRRVRDLLPPLVEKVMAHDAQVAWLCDPMHGNTFTAPSGYKSRRLADVMDEVAGFFEVHRALGSHPGGLHLELTGEDVTECVGGRPPIGLEDVPRRYETACDPRLNRDQALELASLVAGLFRARADGPARLPSALFSNSY